MKDIVIKVGDDCVYIDFGHTQVLGMLFPDGAVAADILTQEGSRVCGTWADRVEIEGVAQARRNRSNTLASTPPTTEEDDDS